MDIYRTATAAVSLVVGLLITYRAVALGFFPLALLVGLGFILFAAHRLVLAGRRYRQYRTSRTRRISA